MAPVGAVEWALIGVVPLEHRRLRFELGSMSIHSWVIVEQPDSRGLRKVTINGGVVGSAWSSRELRKILRRLGYPKTMNLEDPKSIYWRGGDSRTWPDHPWRRRGTLVLMIAGMLGSAVMHIAVGWPDAIQAFTFAQRIIGTIFVLAGLLQCAAIIAVLDYWGKRQLKPSGAISLLGAFIALATSITLVFMWLEETEYTPYLLVFAPLCLWSLWALFLLIREKAWQATPHPKKFAAGVTATALLTAVSIAYSTMYQPTAAPIRFILKAEFGTPEASPDFQYVTVPLKLYVKNDGGIAVYIVNDDYTVWGTPIKHSAKGDGLKRWKTDTEEGGYAAEAKRYVREGKADVVSSGHFHELGNLLEPGEEHSSEEAVTLPMNARYDELEATLDIEYIRRDRGRLEEEFQVPVGYSWDDSDKRYYCPPKDCGEYVVYHGQVRHNNNMVNVTRRSRYLAAFWGPEYGFNGFISSFDSEKRTLDIYQGIDDAEIAREADSYGMGHAYTNSIVPASKLLRLVGERQPVSSVRQGDE
jgi:hypothetical protein